MKKIQLSKIFFEKPNFENKKSTKEKIILDWLISLVNYGISNHLINYGDLLPAKKDLAKYLGVGEGTVQNAIRKGEDAGYFTSKQSIGTMIKNPDTPQENEKMFSKKDKAIIEIKRYIIENKLNIGETLPSLKNIARTINTSENTTRLALETLALQGIIKTLSIQRNKTARIIKTLPQLLPEEISSPKEIENINLSQKTTQKLKDYIIENFTIGDKLPPNNELAKLFNVSIRTLNEAMQTLNEQKIILSRRGKYGTIYLNSPKGLEKQKTREEKSIFMSGAREKVLKKSYQYRWEITLEALKKYITQNHSAGEKIPTLEQLAQTLNVSTNTIRRAIATMREEGYLIAQRGKYGGIYILEIPQEAETYTWLALNPSAVKINKKTGRNNLERP